MKAYCPHCFARSNRAIAGIVQRSVFRCRSEKCRAIRPVKARIDGTVRSLAQGQVLNKATDPVYEAFWGDSRAFSHTFEIRGRKPVCRGACPVCRQTSTIRLCPNCHQEIDSQTGTRVELPFSLIGAPNSGKSSYIATLIAQLNHGAPGRQFGLSAGPDTRTGEIYDENYRPLVGKWDGGQWKERHIRKTNPRKVVPPLVYTIRRPAGDRGARRAVTLCLFDPAGEDLVRDRIEQFHSFVYQCAGLTFLIDGAGLLAPGGHGAKLAQAEQTLNDVVCKVEAHGRARPRVAVAISKSDLLMAEGLLPDSLGAEPEHSGGYDEAASRKHSAIVEKLLVARDGQVFVNQAKSVFGADRVRFFAVSAFGPIRVSPTGNPLEEIRPVRVCEPFLWTLSQAGLIPRRSAP